LLPQRYKIYLMHLTLFSGETAGVLALPVQNNNGIHIKYLYLKLVANILTVSEISMHIDCLLSFEGI